MTYIYIYICHSNLCMYTYYVYILWSTFHIRYMSVVCDNSIENHCNSPIAGVYIHNVYCG